MRKPLIYNTVFGSKHHEQGNAPSKLSSITINPRIVHQDKLGVLNRWTHRLMNSLMSFPSVSVLS
jgi:hypothetical protein